MKMHTRFEISIKPYKGKLNATVYDDYWDTITNLFYGEGHPERATGVGKAPVSLKAWKALTPEIATLTPGWYAILMPADAYPFGDTFRLIRIPERHLRYKDERRAAI